jgi:DNA-directed RNA polymerase subunit RPC12/RpoP
VARARTRTVAPAGVLEAAPAGVGPVSFAIAALAWLWRRSSPRDEQVNPWLREPPANVRPRRDASGMVIRCPACNGTGFRPMPWRNVRGLRRFRMVLQPSRRDPAGWGACPDCRHGVLVERVEETREA